MGPAAVLIKGGHLDAKHTQLMDYLLVWHAIDEDGKKILRSRKNFCITVLIQPTRTVLAALYRLRLLDLFSARP
jgi:hypothetical protein